MKKLTWIFIRSIVAATLVFALFGFPDSALAFRGGYHFELTRDCLMREGFSQNAIQLVQVSNAFSDIATDIPEGGLIDRSEREELQDGSSRTVPMNSIFAAAAQYLHWGYLSGYDMINAEWERLEANTRFAIQEALDANGGAGDVEGILVALGTSLHVVQDFYAHSNWSDINWYGDATWFDVYPLATGMGGDKLYTFGGDESDIAHDKINKDYAGREHFETAYREAFYATCQWVELVKAWVSPGFWEAAKTYDRRSFEEDEKETRQLLWYLGTWKEPPLPNPPGQGWTSCHVFGCDYQGSTEDLVFAALGFMTNDNHTWQVWTHYAHIIASPKKAAVSLPAGEYMFIPRHDWVVIDTERVRQTDSYSWDIDPGDEADFYAKIWATGINTEGYRAINRDTDRLYIETMYEGYDDLYPNWLTLIPYEPPEEHQDYMGFEYGIWDDDGTGVTFRAGDTRVDIDPQADHTTLVFGISPLMSNYGLPSFFNIDFPMTIEYQGGGGDGDEAYVKVIVDYTQPARAELQAFPNLDSPILVATVALPPDGFVDVANCQQISGWAWDPKTPNQPISVEIYDVRDGTETLLSSILAELPREDLGAILGDNGNHGFSIQTSSILHDGQEHQLRVYAVNSNPAFPNAILPPSSSVVPPVLVCPQFQSEPTSTDKPTDTHTAEPTSTSGQETSPVPGFSCPGAALLLAVSTVLRSGKRRHQNKDA